MRLIDADALIADIQKKLAIKDIKYLTEQEETITKMIINAPTVGEWIPVSHGLPSEPFGCLVIVEDSYFDGCGWSECKSILPYFVGWDGKQWNDGDGEQCPFEVIAWMPLPEPYMGGDTE